MGLAIRGIRRLNFLVAVKCWIHLVILTVDNYDQVYLALDSYFTLHIPALQG